MHTISVGQTNERGAAVGVAAEAGPEDADANVMPIPMAGRSWRPLLEQPACACWQ